MTPDIARQVQRPCYLIWHTNVNATLNHVLNVVIMRAGHVVALMGTEDNGPRA